MEQFLKRIENLLTVKSIVTLALTAVFAGRIVWLAIVFGIGGAALLI